MKRRIVDEPNSDYLLCSENEVLGNEDLAKQDPSQPCYVDSVSDEVLASIMRLLPWKNRIASVERVSRRWQRVALERGWRDFTLVNSRDWGIPEDRSGKVTPKVAAFLYLNDA